MTKFVTLSIDRLNQVIGALNSYCNTGEIECADDLVAELLAKRDQNTVGDRELLEFAAKAAGLKPEEADWTKRAGLVWVVRCACGIRKEIRWNPINDDGDALRLAIRLGMKLSTNLHHRFVVVNDEQEFYDEAKFGGVCDPEGVMRITIVRVAAEIGKNM